ncbi:hypothetical protein ONZ45_g11566 [Pleurotus djamor]|nr:hypothetical protein ONZ45_g11566 [Pleurotus djamor]
MSDAITSPRRFDVPDKKDPREYINQLTPPAGTSFWRHQTFTPFDQVSVANLRDKLATFTWRIDAYVYAVNAIPDENFASNGGLVYVVLVHSGAAATAKNIEPSTMPVYWPLEFEYDVSLPNSNGDSFMHQPTSNSGTQDGDTYKYTIAYAQDFQMFRNGGNEAFTFPAKYADDINFYMGEQSGTVQGSYAIRWGSLLQQEHYDDPENEISFPFTSLSVFRFDALEEVRFHAAHLPLRYPLYLPGICMGDRSMPSTLTSELFPTCGTRTIIDIIWSCLAIIFVCIWTAVHPDIFNDHVEHGDIISSRWLSISIAFLAPEVIVSRAVWQWIRVKEIDDTRHARLREKRSLLDKIMALTFTPEVVMKLTHLRRGRRNPIIVRMADDQVVTREAIIYEGGSLPQLHEAASSSPADGAIKEGGHSESKSELSEPSKHKAWTRAHSFFLDMQGFLVKSGNGKIRALTLEDITSGRVPWPEVSYTELCDRSKGDGFAKSVTILQLSWFTAQLIGRKLQGLAITELEVMTLAYTLTCGILYAFWFDKPYNVKVPIIISTKLDSLPPPTKSLVGTHRMQIAILITGSLFGAVHLLAWNFDFPTRAEQISWISVRNKRDESTSSTHSMSKQIPEGALAFDNINS